MPPKKGRRPPSPVRETSPKSRPPDTRRRTFKPSGIGQRQPKQEPASGHREHRDHEQASGHREHRDQERAIGHREHRDQEREHRVIENIRRRENELRQHRHRAEEQTQSEPSVISKRPQSIKLVPANACQSDTAGSAADNSRRKQVPRPSRGQTTVWKSRASSAPHQLTRVGAPSMIDPSPRAARIQPRGTAGSEAPGLEKPRQTKPAESRRCVVDTRQESLGPYAVDVEESSEVPREDDEVEGSIEQEAPYEDDELDDRDRRLLYEEEVVEIERDEEECEEEDVAYEEECEEEYEYDDRPADQFLDEMHVAWNPVPVALMAAGLKNRDQMKEVKAMLRRNVGAWFEWCVLDRLWKDPSKGGIGHRENGTHPNTQKQVFKQEGFVPLVKEMVQWTIEVTTYAQDVDPGDASMLYPEGIGIVVECHHGCHRSDTVMRKVQEMLNSVRAPNGVRMFNCNIFPMVWAYGYGGIREMVKEAELWVSSPWELAMDMSRAPRESLYGALNCQHDHLASQACEALWQWKQTQLPDLLAALIDDRLPENPCLQNCLCTVPAHEADLDNRSNVGQSGQAEQMGYTRSLPVYQHSHSESLDDVIYINNEMFCRTGTRTSAQGDVPTYVSLEFDAYAWFHILQEYSIDELGKQNFFELAQCHPNASFECMDILMKLKNKAFHGEFRDNTSDLPEVKRINRWFHKSTSKARTRLTKWYYGDDYGKSHRRAKNSRREPY